NGDPITLSGSIPTSDITPAIPSPLPPTDTYVVTTGDQQNTIYFTAPASSAPGYLIYSSPSPGGENYDQALFGIILQGGPGWVGIHGATDSGEPDGVNRYYTAKMAYIN